jgi:hypothetical protein
MLCGSRRATFFGEMFFALSGPVNHGPQQLSLVYVLFAVLPIFAGFRILFELLSVIQNVQWGRCCRTGLLFDHFGS